MGTNESKEFGSRSTLDQDYYISESIDQIDQIYRRIPITYAILITNSFLIFAAVIVISISFGSNEIYHRSLDVRITEIDDTVTEIFRLQAYQVGLGLGLESTEESKPGRGRGGDQSRFSPYSSPLYNSR